MTTDRLIIDLYTARSEDGNWDLSTDDICLAKDISRTTLYKILKRNNILPRDRKNKVNLEEAFGNLERAIKLLRKVIKQELKIK